MDGFFIKYLASVIALLAYAAPLYFRDPSLSRNKDDTTQDYIRAMRLLQNTSRSAINWAIQSRPPFLCRRLIDY
jgi:hypothetical protein